MKISKKDLAYKLLVTLFILFHSNSAFAYNIKQLSNIDGLSNSSVLNLYQDKNSFLWISTFDGLNMYDGSKVHVYRSLKNNANFSSQVIRKTIETQSGIYWLQTYLGLNKFSMKDKKIEKYFTNTEAHPITKNSKNELFALGKVDSLAYYNPHTNTFEEIPLRGVNNNWIQSFEFDSNDHLWIFMSTGIYWKLAIRNVNGKKKIEKLQGLPIKETLKYCFYENDDFYFIDQKRNFYTYNVKTEELVFKANIRDFVESNGVVSSIVRFEDGFLFAFEYNGLYKVTFPSTGILKYQDLHINCGVYKILKEKSQNIYWIATDGQGIYTLWNDEYSIKNYTNQVLPIEINKPVRAIYLDTRNNLWIGTKGEGILKFKDFNFDRGAYYSQSVDQYQLQKSFNYKLVYSFKESRHGIMWIGGDWPGLSYYSYKDHKTYQTNTLDRTSPLYINFVHSIIEANDTTLWLGTYGNGFLKTIFSKNGFKIKSVKRYDFKDAHNPSNIAFDRFNAVFQENDSILWLGARMNGVIRFNIRTEKYQIIRFNKEGIEQLNDIMSICKDKYGTMWFGTNFGLIRLNRYGKNNLDYEVINEEDGVTNNAIVGILSDNQGLLYLSTNKGLDIYNPKTKKIHHVNDQNGLKVTEFSLDAYFQRNNSNILFFGGTNGFCALRREKHHTTGYNPAIHFMGIRIFGEYSDLSDFLISRKDKEYIQLKYSQNFFSINFVALDYINGINTEYMYQLENYNDKWIDLGKNNTATFTNIPPGKYKLNIKCKSQGQGYTDNMQSIDIIITPPWYWSVPMKLIYLLLLGFAIWYSITKLKRDILKKRNLIIEKLIQNQKKENYDSKLNFLSKIVQEFTTPLTLITGPCQLILDYGKDDEFITEHGSLIYSNAEKINNLIKQLSDFKQVNPENQQCTISNVNIYDTAESIFKQFLEEADIKNIDYKFDATNDLFWNTNEELFSKILNILITNALYHTEDGGEFRLTLSKTTPSLQMIVYYTGQGMNKEESDNIFNRYEILDNLVDNDQSLASSETILGFGICYNLVKTLKGEIKVTSEVNQFTQFEVVFPFQEINLEESKTKHTNLPEVHIDKTKELSKPTVLIIDEDKEMLWFLNEIFSSEYVIYTVSKGNNAKQMLDTKRIDIIILNEESTKIESEPAIDFIKNNAQTKHIPLILLSSNTDMSDEESLYNSGADAYIRKPFNVNYLKKRVDLMLKSNEYLRAYYSSSISSFELLDGHLIHQDDKAFLNRIIEIIDNNLTKQEITLELIAEKVLMSQRKLYRKIKQLTGKSPTEFIKNYKLELSATLLKKSSATVQEIMYQVGFNNRAYFYKEFTKKFNVSPGKYRDVI